LLIVIISYSCQLYSYSLGNRWIPPTPNNDPLVLNVHTSLDEAMGILSSDPINFDPDGALEMINWWDDYYGTEEYYYPKIVMSGYPTSNDNVRPILTYENFGEQEFQRKMYGRTGRAVGEGEDWWTVKQHPDFSISLNSNAELPWNSNGGGTEGGVDINTVFLHEVGHAFGLGHHKWDRYFNQDPDPDFLSLMSNATVYASKNHPTHFWIDDTSWAGLIAIYEPPEFREEYGRQAFIIDRPVTFKASGPAYIPFPQEQVGGAYGHETEVRFHAFIKHPGEESYRDEFYISENEIPEWGPEWGGWHLWNWWRGDINFTPSQVGAYKIKVYTAMGWNLYGSLEDYERLNRPYAEIEFTVYDDTPHFEYFKYKQPDGNDYKNVSMATNTHLIGASWYRYNDKNVPVEQENITGMRFFYRFEDDISAKEDFTEIYGVIKKDYEGHPSVYEAEWNDAGRRGKVTIRTEGTAIINGQSETLTHEKEIELIDRYLAIKKPAPMDIVDFEANLMGVVYPNGSLGYWELTNFMSKVNIIAEANFDSYRFYNSELWPIFYNSDGDHIYPGSDDQLPDSTTYWWHEYYEKNAGIVSGKNVTGSGVVLISNMTEKKDDAKKHKNMTEFDEGMGCGEVLRCQPGIYTLKHRAHELVDNYWPTTCELAHGEKTNFFIPWWKLKTWGGDYRIYPPMPKIYYAKDNSQIPLCIWRPVIGKNGTPVGPEPQETYLSAKRDDSGSTVWSSSKKCSAEKSEIIEWETEALQAGFYTVTGNESDWQAEKIVEHKSEIQICPFYEHCEWEGSFSPNWEDGFDPSRWKINKYLDSGQTHLNFATKEVLRDYGLTANYSTEMNIVESYLISKPVTIEYYPDYDVYIDYCIGLPAKDENNKWVWEELLADYSIEASEDGGAKWTVLKTANHLERAFLKDPVTNLTFVPFTHRIKKAGAKGGQVMIRLSIKGKVFTLPEEDEITQVIFFDEIVVKHHKGPSILAPNNPQITGIGSGIFPVKENALTVSWTHPSASEYEILRYNVIRNGIKIVDVDKNANFFTDRSINPEGKYNYAIEAVYNIPEDVYVNGANKHTSLLDCSIWVDLKNLPRPRNLTADTGSEVECNNVTLNWDELKEGLDVSGYKIYRDGNLIGTTKKNYYIDYFLQGGKDYVYEVSATHRDPSGETLNSNKVSVNIPDIIFPPYYCSFENDGLKPNKWTINSSGIGQWEFMLSDRANEISAQDGEFFAILSSIDNYYIESDLTTGKFWTEGYTGKKFISFYYKAVKPISGVLVTLDIYCNSTLIKSLYNSYPLEWTYYEIELPNTITTPCDFTFRGKPGLLPQGDYTALCIDNVAIWDDSYVPVPKNIRITNNQGFVSLTWDKVPGATAYIVYRSEYPDKNFTEIARVDKFIHGTQEIQNNCSDVVRKPGNIFVPAVDNFKKPYYYKVATEVEIKLKLSSNR
jgi:hypothetical protein